MNGTAGLAAVYVTQVLAGLVVLRLLDDRSRRWSERLARALLLGPCALTLQMLACDALGLRFALPLLLGPWWVAVGVLAWRARGRTRAAPPEAGCPWRRAAIGLAAVAVAAALVRGLAQPVHATDSMFHFAQLARVYEAHGGLAPQAVRALQAPGHVDYPPLVALNEALVFMAASGERGLAVKPFFALGWLALLLLAVEACFAALRPRAAALAAAAVVLLPLPAQLAAEGYADVHLSAAVLALALQGRGLLAAPSARAAALYAACVVSCALVKFEGLALALPAALLPLLAARRGAQAGRPALTARAALAAAGAALALAAWWPLHLAWHGLGEPPLLDAAWHDVARAAGRAPEVAARFAGLVLARDLDGHFAWGGLWFLAGAWALVGLARGPQRRAAATALALFAAHVGLYLAVLALSPAPVAWHVGTAGARLLLHALPWALLAALAGLARGWGRSAPDA